MFNPGIVDRFDHSIYGPAGETYSQMDKDSDGSYVQSEDYDRLLHEYLNLVQQSNIGPKPSTVVPLADYLNPQKTLRDEFAMAALLVTLEGQEQHAMSAVQSAYFIANLMLEHRLKEKV